MGVSKSERVGRIELVPGVVGTGRTGDTRQLSAADETEDTGAGADLKDAGQQVQGGQATVRGDGRQLRP